MKYIFYSLLGATVMASCSATVNEEDATVKEEIITEVIKEEETTEKKKQPKSPRKQSESDQISIDYGSPYVKGRTIWGELVPYDKVWRAGANEATAITFKNDVQIKGSDVAAGTYALFIIPKAEGDWTVILNEAKDAWGAYSYKEKEDVLRFDVSPVKVEENTESMTFNVDGHKVSFSWELISFNFEAVTK